MMGTEDDDTTTEEGMSQVCSPLHFYFIFFNMGTCACTVVSCWVLLQISFACLELCPR